MRLGRSDPAIGLVLHVHREVMHHGAEVCLLRDLYRHERCLVTSSVQAWDEVRGFALGSRRRKRTSPGETVIKVRRKAGIPPGRKEGVHGAMFLWMGQRDS